MKSTALTTPKHAPKPITDEASAAAAIQSHCQTLESGVRLSLASMIALGASLAHAKNVLGYSVGRPSEKCSSDLNISENTPKREPWPKLAARLTGKSYFWCQTLQKAAARIITQLEKSDAPTDQQAAAVLSAPPAEWTAEDYDGLSAVLANRFDADTFTGLLGELGLLGGGHEENPGHRLDDHRGGSGQGSGGEPPTPPKKPGRAEEAQLFFSPVWRTLLDARSANLDNYRQRLHALPLRSADPLKKLGLLDLKAEHEAHLAEINAALEARQN